jgi:hypothetical protein
VNWTLSPAKSVEVSVKMPAAPKSVRAVAAQKPVEFKYADGRVTFMADVADGEFFVLAR